MLSLTPPSLSPRRLPFHHSPRSDLPACLSEGICQDFCSLERCVRTLCLCVLVQCMCVCVLFLTKQTGRRFTRLRECLFKSLAGVERNRAPGLERACPRGLCHVSLLLPSLLSPFFFVLSLFVFRKGEHYINVWGYQEWEKVGVIGTVVTVVMWPKEVCLACCLHLRASHYQGC